MSSIVDRLGPYKPKGVWNVGGPLIIPDLSGKGHNAVNNGATLGQPGPEVTAARFSSANYFVANPVVQNGTQAFACGWFKSTRQQHQDLVATQDVSISADAGLVLQCGPSPNGAYAQALATTGGVVTVANINTLDGLWHFILTRWNAPNFDMFENGVLVDHETWGDNTNVLVASSRPVVIGNNSGQSSGFLSRMVDNLAHVAIGNGAPSDATILALYNARTDLTTYETDVLALPALLGYWPLTEDPGSTIAHDISPSANDAVLNGGAVFGVSGPVG